VVIGGGKTAYQKITGLLEAGADVFVVAPEVAPEVRGLIREGRLQFAERKYQRGDLSGAVLAFGATNQASVNRQIRQEAQEKGIWFNAVDQPADCDFTSPARVSRGEFLITVSTGGQAPFLSKTIRERLDQLFGEEYEVLTKMMGALRLYLMERGRKDELSPFFEKRGEALLKALQKKDWKGVEGLLRESFGKISLEEFEIL
jgi:precorrin-2 dehydrogenase/sirohydrochlorin ferrochelatase